MCLSQFRQIRNGFVMEWSICHKSVARNCDGVESQIFDRIVMEWSIRHKSICKFLTDCEGYSSLSQFRQKFLTDLQRLRVEGIKIVNNEVNKHLQTILIL